MTVRTANVSPRCAPILARAAAVTVAALLAGCGAGAADDAAPDDGLATFVVSDTAVLVLEDDGTPEKLFERVAVRRLPGGEIVVGDRGSSSIHVFGRDGAPLRRLARRGGGPGELQGEFELVSRGDTVLALGQPPFGPSDVHVFHAVDGFVRRFRPEAAGTRIVTAIAPLASDALLVQKGMSGAAFMDTPPVGRLLHDSLVVGAMRSPERGDSAIVTWLPPVPKVPLLTFEWRNSRVGVSMAPYRFAPHTIVVASDDRVWLVRSDSGAVQAVAADGRTVVASRLPLNPEPFDDAAIARARDAELARAERQLDSARVLATYDPAFRPAAMPLVSDAVGGADGELWVRLFALDSAGPRRFVIVDRDGRAVARATIPAGLDVHQIGRDFVLGVRRDSLGVESVHEHALRRP